MAIGAIVTTIKTIVVTIGAIVGTIRAIEMAITLPVSTIGAIAMAIVTIEATIATANSPPPAPKTPSFHAAATPAPPLIGRCSCLAGVIAQGVLNSSETRDIQ